MSSTENNNQSNSRPSRPELIKAMLRSAKMLSLYTVLGIGLLLAVKMMADAPIQQAEKTKLLAEINQVLPNTLYDNNPLEDTLQINGVSQLGSDQAITFYRARKNNEPTGIVFNAIAPNGYSGKITLLIAVKRSGELLGVRVLKHKETPGLGDKIELRKSDWILSFEGRQFSPEKAKSWNVKKNGGDFDQFTGATITPRAIVHAVKNALIFIKAQGDRLYE